MKKSNALFLCLAVFILGFLAGLLWASYKGPPPGLERQARHEHQPQTAGPAETDQAWAQLAELEARIKAAPDQVRLYVQAGNLLFDHEMYQRAAEYYEQALELGLKDPDVLTDAGVCYRRLDQPNKAAGFFRRARQADPAHETSALNLGIVLFHDLGDKKGALKAWREYLALNPKGRRADMIRQVVARLETEVKPDLVKPGSN